MAEVLDFMRPDVLIHGGANGVDKIGHHWGLLRVSRIEVFDVTNEDWTQKGKSAGPERNQAMVDRAAMWQMSQNNVICLAFPHPDSVGTRDCMFRAVGAGIPVLEYK